MNGQTRLSEQIHIDLDKEDKDKNIDDNQEQEILLKNQDINSDEDLHYPFNDDDDNVSNFDEVTETNHFKNFDSNV